MYRSYNQTIPTVWFGVSDLPVLLSVNKRVSRPPTFRFWSLSRPTQGNLRGQEPNTYGRSRTQEDTGRETFTDSELGERVLLWSMQPHSEWDHWSKMT